jgi:hypothetical protein
MSEEEAKLLLVDVGFVDVGFVDVGEIPRQDNLDTREPREPSNYTGSSPLPTPYPTPMLVCCELEHFKTRETSNFSKYQSQNISEPRHDTLQSRTGGIGGHVVRRVATKGLCIVKYFKNRIEKKNARSNIVSALSIAELSCHTGRHSIRSGEIFREIFCWA